MSKIAIIHSIYKPYVRGGAEVVVDKIVGGLKEGGHDVFVIAIGRENKKENIEGVDVYRIKPFNFFNFLDINNKSFWLRFLWHILDMFNDVQTWQIYNSLKKEKPDLVMTHNLKGLGYYIPWLLRLIKIRHIHTVHDAQLLHPSGLTDQEANLGLWSRVYSWVCKKLFGSPEMVIFPSRYSQGVYDKWGFFEKSKKVVLGNPISLNCKNIKSLNQDCFNIMFLGQVEEYKGVLELVEAFKEMPITNHQSPITLHIVGDGAALKEARELSVGQNNIKFYGRLSQGRLEKEIWPKIDLLVNPSKVPESFGMVVAEAMAHGVPVLASNIGALPELVDNNTGYLLGVGDVDDLKKKLKNILENSGDLDKLSDNCFKKIEDFSLNNYLKKLERFGRIY